MFDNFVNNDYPTSWQVFFTKLSTTGFKINFFVLLRVDFYKLFIQRIENTGCAKKDFPSCQIGETYSKNLFDSHLKCDEHTDQILLTYFFEELTLLLLLYFIINML